jgi:flagellar biosynthesis protein FliQ
VSAGDVAGLQVVRRAAITTLGVAVPLIPIQAFFGTIVSVLSAITVVASLNKTS